uniref:Uncharacterized protein n=1 Tax=Candidatus Kentrum eta TaxID=2126337 RepID=A0A450VVV0_9GAMM|nr:MAG: hypothetical protein BECKH772A_GA0070896_100873 [Candidatus Kentron sp. H]VFK05126.1 MAG: hypothetical protein BECKH772B_GA0070898_105353 [Candidatus Kentron sp. H]VFK08938.1 MAG: hypothetical protein BECKH772C_GA0070978_105623 [Candidatus Kentron sp. H]
MSTEPNVFLCGVSGVFITAKNFFILLHLVGMYIELPGQLRKGTIPTLRPPELLWP